MTHPAIAPGIVRALEGRACRGGLCATEPTHVVIWEDDDVPTQYWPRCAKHAEKLVTNLRTRFPEARVKQVPLRED